MGRLIITVAAKIALMRFIIFISFMVFNVFPAVVYTG
jgi:hypothetical protein